MDNGESVIAKIIVAIICIAAFIGAWVVMYSIFSPNDSTTTRIVVEKECVAS